MECAQRALSCTIEIKRLESEIIIEQKNKNKQTIKTTLLEQFQNQILKS